MMKSMTGFGSSLVETDGFKISVEVKTLNSKTLDASMRLPRQFSDKELEVRNILNESLERGKVSLNIEFQKTGNVETSSKVNLPIFKAYYQQLAEAAEAVGAGKEDLFRLALGMNNSIETSSEGKTSEDEWKLVLNGLKTALAECNSFRNDEGKKLEEKFVSYIDTIESLLKEVINQDPNRIENLKKRISDKISDLLTPEQIDKNRFEQELIYYIEKLDITEEKVRLQNHLNYFREVMNSAENTGKKLGFIAQELGREINTIGSKANDVVIQKSVVCMKEELEKIKEQLLNIL